jgi:thiamine-phosphate pyrophosphorylase
MEFDTTLYFITDSTGYELDEFLRRVRSALEGGVTIIQLREKNRTTREYIELANAVHEITKEFGVPLIIDDRIDVMLATGAEGVHVGAEDMPVAMARQLIGKDKILGATAKTVEAATKAYNDGADYLGVGAIYPTTTKVKTVLTSTETLDAITKAVPIPVNAIGGLNSGNIQILRGINIAGVCAVSAIMKAVCPKTAAEELKNAFEDLRSLK